MKLLIVLLCICFCAVPASALEIEAPPVPATGREWMPENTDSLLDGMIQMIRRGITALRPDLQEATRVCLGIFASVMIVSILQSFSGGTNHAAQTAGTVAVASLLLLNTNSMISLASSTVREIGNYGKLLLPVMTTALAAQGGVSSSAAMYAGTAMFTSLLQSAMDSILVPSVYLYLALGVGNGTTGEDLLKKTAEQLKGLLSWCFKTLLIIFTSFLSLTGVISGTMDQAALKAAKVTMSSFIPVVGGILSDASEAVLVSAGLMKNTAGIYGILAVLAICIHPFLQIGAHYLLLKLTAAISAVFGTSRITEVISTFSSALGLLLAMTAAACVMVLISTVCFMKGVG